LGGSGGSSRERLPSPIRLSQSETVESAKPRTSAIWAAVIRSLRSFSITATVLAASWVGERCGREERSRGPGSPSASQRASQR
jgi:hypothetical protein